MSSEASTIDAAGADTDRAGLVRAESNPHRRAIEPANADGFDTTWPVKWPEAARLLVAAVVIVGTGIVVGLGLTDWAAPNAVTRLDERISNWFVDGRTDGWNSFSHVAAFPADTIPKIVISALICCFFLLRWRRWDEAVYVALPLVFEATCFVAITRTVLRPRPDFEDQLIHSTIDSSFPSGHVAAATVYMAVVVVVFRHTTAVWARALAVTLFVLVAVGVYWARLYQGVHFASDVVAGIILGTVSVIVTDRVLRRRPHPTLDHA